jgi:hypothetical protein
MKHFMLGEVQINVQDERNPNEDVFMISTNSFGGDQGNIASILANHVEDPERFVLYSEAIYTKQPDAAIELASYLNQKKGIAVSAEEVDYVREQLINILK